MAANSLDWKAVVKSTGLRLVVMMVGLYLVSGILEPNYLQPSHIMSTLVLCCFWGIICIGQTLIILTGGADLSVAYSVTFSRAGKASYSLWRMRSRSSVLMMMASPSIRNTRRRPGP